MQGSGVNTYKLVNDDGKAVLVKFHWEPNQGIKNLTQKEAEEIQGQNFNHATQDLYEAIEEGNYPEWELYVQIMEDGEHPELDFDPLDDTKLWPEDQFHGFLSESWCSTRILMIILRKLSNLHSVRVYWLMALISLMIKCCKGVPSLIPIHNDTVLEQIIYNCQLTVQGQK